MAKVLVPVPTRDFDPSEVAVPWRLLKEQGHTVLFTTPDGHPGVADDIMVTGKGLDLWGWIPGLANIRLFGLLLRANADARSAYAQLLQDPDFLAPCPWAAATVDMADGLLLPGGHRARGSTQYLESQTLQDLVVAFFTADKPVAAVCHGVLLAARSTVAATGRSILYGRRTTALTWALESKAAALGNIFRYWDHDYYRTYPDQPGQPHGYMSVQQEVTRLLARPDDFLDVPRTAPNYSAKTSGLARDSKSDKRPAFVVRDRNYLSARWPGDVHTLGSAFAALLSGKEPVETLY